MNATNEILMTTKDAWGLVKYLWPSKLLNERRVSVLSRIPSQKFQAYLWNLIDHTRDPDPLWLAQQRGVLMTLIKRNKPEDYEQIEFLWWKCELNDTLLEEKYYEALSQSCHWEQFYLEWC